MGQKEGPEETSREGRGRAENCTKLKKRIKVGKTVINPFKNEKNFAFGVIRLSHRNLGVAVTGLLISHGFVTIINLVDFIRDYCG